MTWVSKPAALDCEDPPLNVIVLPTTSPAKGAFNMNDNAGQTQGPLLIMGPGDTTTHGQGLVLLFYLY